MRICNSAMAAIKRLPASVRLRSFLVPVEVARRLRAITKYSAKALMIAALHSLSFFAAFGSKFYSCASCLSAPAAAEFWSVVADSALCLPRHLRTRNVLA